MKSKSTLSRERILESARELILNRGYSAMTVDAVCQSAGITKGGFFHHFPSKDALGEAVLAKFWRDVEDRQEAAPFREAVDPIQYLEGYLDHAIESYQDPQLQKGCMLAIFTVELAESNEPLFRSASRYFDQWRAEVKGMLTRASSHAQCNIDVQAWCDLYIATLEGAMLLTKAHNDPHAISRSLTLYKTLVLKSLRENDL